MSALYSCIQKALFQIPPELAHDVALESIGASERLNILSTFAPKVKSLPVELMGLSFPNPVGLAAGLDKNGDYFNGLGKLGFGFVEIGTITPKSQPGNSGPRLFRIPEEKALINRLGFNNKGVQHLVSQVKKAPLSRYIGH